MKESGIDLSYDMDQSGGQKQAPAVTFGAVGTTTSSLTMPAGTMPSKPFSHITKPTVRLRADLKLKLAKQKMEDEERRRRQSAATATSSGAQQTVTQPTFTVKLSSSVNESLSSQNTLNYHHSSASRQVSNGGDSLTGMEQSVANTAPARYYIVSENSPGTSVFPISTPIGVQDGRRSVTSEISGCEDVASAATSYSEIDDFFGSDILSGNYSIEQCDSKDLDFDVLSELLPQATLSSASYADNSQLDVKPPIHQCASFPSMAVRPPGYRGGRLKEPPPKNMKDMTEEELAQYKKERQKKDTHNEIEKRRRQKINECIQALGTMLPSNYDIDFQNKKGAILEGTVKYLKHLLEQEKEMKRLMEVEEQLTAQNRQLILTIQEYQLILQNKQAAQQNNPKLSGESVATPVTNTATVTVQQPHLSHVLEHKQTADEVMLHLSLDTGMETDNPSAVSYSMCDRDLVDLGHCLRDDPMFPMSNVGFENQMVTDNAMFETLMSDEFLHPFE